MRLEIQRYYYHIKERYGQVFWEFARYLLVGGTAFIADFCVLMVFNDFLLPEMFGYKLYIATFAGFIVGLILNYVLSIKFVFRVAKDSDVGKSFSAFIIFIIIGIIGLVLTELGMYAGSDLLNINYLIVKIIVTGVVLLWNYIARKILIFNK